MNRFIRLRLKVKAFVNTFYVKAKKFLSGIHFDQYSIKSLDIIIISYLDVPKYIISFEVLNQIELSV